MTLLISNHLLSFSIESFLTEVLMLKPEQGPTTELPKIRISDAETTSYPRAASSKRGSAESIEELQASRKKMGKIIKESKQKLSRNCSYDAEYVDLSNSLRLKI